MNDVIRQIQVTVLPTVSDMGLTVKAYMEDPRSSQIGV